MRVAPRCGRPHKRVSMSIASKAPEGNCRELSLGRLPHGPAVQAHFEARATLRKARLETPRR